MGASAELELDTIDLYVLRAGQLSLRVPRHLEQPVTTTLKSNDQDVGVVHHRIQESADLLQDVGLVLGAVVDLASVVHMILSVRGPAGSSPRIRYRRRLSSTTFEADGYDADSVAKIIRALGEDFCPGE